MKLMSSSNPVTNLDRSPGRLVLAVVVLIGIFHAVTLRDGHEWGGDFAQYIVHAGNLAEGRSYAETGIIYNPHNIVLGPRAYPPGFPVLLAPFYAGFGANLHVFKLVQIGLLCVTLFLLPRLFPDLSRTQQLLLIVLAGMNPLMWISRDAIQSEHLFVPLWHLSLFWGTACIQKDRAGSVGGIVLGLLVFATCQTRTAGIVLLPALIVADLIWRRRLSRIVLTAIAAVIGLTVLQKLMMPDTGSGYVEQLRRISIDSLTYNVRQNLSALSQIFDNGHSSAVRRLMMTVTMVIAVVGVVIHNRPRIRLIGIASLFYVALVTVWPTAAGLRIVMPLVPVFLFYVVVGLKTCSEKLGQPLTPVFVVLILASFVGHYSAADYSSIDDGPNRATAQELFETIRATTSPDDVFLFFKPRVLRLYAGRRAAAFPEADSGVDWKEWASEINANFVVVRSDAHAQSLAYMHESRDPQPEGVMVFQNRDFRMFRLRP